MTENPLYWTLRAVARLERRGDLRKPRLTEPGLKKWHRMRRRLGFVDLIALLHEDLAEAFPYPFDLSRWAAEPLADLDDEQAEALIQEALAEDDSSTQSFLRQAARALGLPAGGAIAQLPKVQPHHDVLELPGCGGRIAAQQAIEHGVAIADRFTFVAGSDAEQVCIGLAVVEVRSNAPRVWSLDQAGQEFAKGARFDQIFGVPDHEAAQRLVEAHSLEVRWS